MSIRTETDVRAGLRPNRAGALGILHTTDFFNRANTGITRAIATLIEQTRESLPQGSRMALVTAGEVDVEVPRGTELTAVPVGPGGLARAWCYAPLFAQSVESLISDSLPWVVHVHGVWLHPQFAAIRAARRRGARVVLTNHGHLEDWALRQPGVLGAAKKRAYLEIMRRPLFREVDIFHAISPRNRDMVHRLFPRARVELIPNSSTSGPSTFCLTITVARVENGPTSSSSAGWHLKRALTS